MGKITRVKDWETEEILFEDDLDAEFNNLYDLVNGNLDEANIADGSLDLSVVGEANSIGTSLLSAGAVTPSKMNINDDLDFGGNKATNLADGTQNSDAATVSQLGGLTDFSNWNYHSGTNGYEIQNGESGGEQTFNATNDATVPDDAVAVYLWGRARNNNDDEGFGPNVRVGTFSNGANIYLAVASNFGGGITGQSGPNMDDSSMMLLPLDQGRFKYDVDDGENPSSNATLSIIAWLNP